MKFAVPLLIATAFVEAAQAEVMSDRYLFNGGDAYWINRMRDETRVPNRLIVKRPWGSAPLHCVATVNDRGYCNPYDLEIYDIYYEDCNAPWTVCRCNNVPGNYNIDVIANNIGKLPVRARSWVRHFSFYASGDNPHNTGNDINIFGDYAVSTVLYHETMHSLDYWVVSNARGFLAGDMASWRQAADQDSCVPTGYSKASWVEHFAELAVQATYEENFGGIPIGTECMSRTLGEARRLLRDTVKIVPGQMCDNRLAPSPDICMGPEARRQGACDGFLDRNQVTKRDDKEPRASWVEGNITFHEARDLPTVPK